MFLFESFILNFITKRKLRSSSSNKKKQKKKKNEEGIENNRILSEPSKFQLPYRSIPPAAAQAPYGCQSKNLPPLSHTQFKTEDTRLLQIALVLFSYFCRYENYS